METETAELAEAGGSAAVAEQIEAKTNNLTVAAAEPNCEVDADKPVHCEEENDESERTQIIEDDTEIWSSSVQEQIEQQERVDSPLPQVDDAARRSSSIIWMKETNSSDSLCEDSAAKVVQNNKSQEQAEEESSGREEPEIKERPEKIEQWFPSSFEDSQTKQLQDKDKATEGNRTPSPNPSDYDSDEYMKMRVKAANERYFQDINIDPESLERRNSKVNACRNSKEGHVICQLREHNLSISKT
ncbi:hypothetical protein Ciccas_004852 [Cichlidogyrus casuarinus]|uniref:Uncharacterized protein n=1 Tax=Cichlidogyrus casuarinus TaxID=1844966 RepID=A0ABD2QAE1_9PLAT